MATSVDTKIINIGNFSKRPTVKHDISKPAPLFLGNPQVPRKREGKSLKKSGVYLSMVTIDGASDIGRINDHNINFTVEPNGEGKKVTLEGKIVLGSIWIAETSFVRIRYKVPTEYKAKTDLGGASASTTLGSVVHKFLDSETGSLEVTFPGKVTLQPSGDVHFSASYLT